MKKIILSILFLNLVNNLSHSNDNNVFTNKQLLKYKCSSCHSLNIIYQQKLNKEAWKEIIKLMYTENDMPKMIPKEERFVNVETR